MYYANIAPYIRKVFYVTGMYGTVRPDHTHVGVDLSTGAESPLYSIFDGQVIDKGTNSVRGNYVIIKGDNNLAFLYQHMVAPATVDIGERVVINQLVGYEGSTGISTGNHLHMEMQDLSNRNWYWGNDISYYMNPCDYMGIPNQTNAECYYDGTPYVQSSTRKKGFNFVLFGKKRFLS